MSANGQHRVAHCLGVQAAARHPPQQAVLGVDLRRGLVPAAGLAVRRGRDDHAVQVLDAPAVGGEFAGQPVQQLGVGRAVALLAEVVGRADDPPSEMGLPDAVHNDAGRQRVFGPRDPCRQCRTATGGITTVVRQRGFAVVDRGQEAGCHLVLALAPVAALQQVSGRGGRAEIGAGHRSRRGRRLLLIQLRHPLGHRLPLVLDCPFHALRNVGAAGVNLLLDHRPDLPLQRRTLLGRDVQDRGVLVREPLPLLLDLGRAERLLQFIDLLPKVGRLFLPRLALRPVALQFRRVAHRHVHRPVRREKRLDAVIVGVQNRVEFMIVTASAPQSHAEERCGRGVGNVVQNLLPPLLQIDRVVLVGKVPQEAGRDQRVWVAREQFVAGQLFLHKPIRVCRG